MQAAYGLKPNLNEDALQVVRQDLKFRQEPFEWVYDGLKPLLLDEVLTSQKGMHISLAAVYTATGRRLGLQLLPQQVPSSGQLHSASLSKQCII